MVGIGFDAHRFAPKRKLVLGGVVIPHKRGLAGHSDADVLVHAIVDALFGAAGLRDIGYHFPDHDRRWQGVSSLDLLSRAASRLRKEKLQIVNIDSCVIAEEPKIGPYVERIREKIAWSAGVNKAKVSVKGKTTEGMGFAGRREGIAALAVCLVKKR